MFISNLQELVELAECGEAVVWPGNLNFASAKQLIAENPIVQTIGQASTSELI